MRDRVLVRLKEIEEFDVQKAIDLYDRAVQAIAKDKVASVEKGKPRFASARWRASVNSTALGTCIWVATHVDS